MWCLPQDVSLHSPAYLQAGYCIDEGATSDAAEQVLWSTVYRHGRGVFGVSRTTLAIPLLLRSWSFALVACWSNLWTTHLFGLKRVLGQSSAEAWSQSSAIPATGQTTWLSSFPASTRTTSGAGEVEAQPPRYLTSTHLSPFLKEPYSSTRAGWIGLYSNCKTSATSMLLLMTHDQQPTEHRFEVVDGLPPDIDCLNSWLPPLIPPTSLWLHGNQCLTKRRTACFVHSRWPWCPQRLLFIVPVGRRRHYIRQDVARWGGGWIYFSIPPLYFADLPCVISLFLLLPILPISVHSAIWLFLVHSSIVHMLHGDIEVHTTR